MQIWRKKVSEPVFTTPPESVTLRRCRGSPREMAESCFVGISSTGFACDSGPAGLNRRTLFRQRFYWYPLLRTHDQGSQHIVNSLHCLSSASSMKLSRTGFRSTSCISVSRWSSFWIGKNLNRPDLRFLVARRNASDSAWRPSQKLAVDQSAMFHPALA